jgi:hypothetical protein
VSRLQALEELCDGIIELSVRTPAGDARPVLALTEGFDPHRAAKEVIEFAVASARDRSAVRGELASLGPLLVDAILTSSRTAARASRFEVGSAATSPRVADTVARLLEIHEPRPSVRAGPVGGPPTAAEVISALRNVRWYSSRFGRSKLLDQVPRPDGVMPEVQFQWLVAQAQLGRAPWANDVAGYVDQCAGEFDWPPDLRVEFATRRQALYDSYGQRRALRERIVRAIRPSIVSLGRRILDKLDRWGMHRTRRLLVRVGKRVLGR